ncbi:MAG: 50S ribosomal protein L1 [Planctomycetota bacterium]|jgi:large subunit ribosomal protein L1
MKKRSKRYSKVADEVDRSKKYSIEEAVDLVHKTASTKFDETVEIVLRLGIDPRKSDQMVRGSVSLPRGIGKTRMVIVFAEGEDAEEATAAGADEVGGADLVKKIQDGWMDFDVAIAKPSMMRHVGRLGKLLGPQGKMPSPKAGTVTENLSVAVKEFKAGKIEFRADNAGNLHAPMGKKSFEAGALVENVSAFMEHVQSIRPAAVKGAYLLKGTLTTTMGPGVPLTV